jgi:5'-3' exonuclease
LLCAIWQVFDGRNLPSKAETEKKRRKNRQENREKAVKLLQEGK